MAQTLSKTNIVNGNTIQAADVSQSIDAFTGVEAYNITVSGSLTLTGSLGINGLSQQAYDRVLVINSTTGNVAYTASSALAGVTINNNTNNNLLTATGTANTIDGESNLTFDGSVLRVVGMRVTTGSNAFNTIIGFSASINGASGGDNTSIGYSAGRDISTGQYNTAVGGQALPFTSTGVQNTAVGFYALRNNTSGSSNTAVGDHALAELTGPTANNNTAIGSNALIGALTSSYNVAIGSNAGAYISGSGGDNTNPSSSIYLGTSTVAKNTSSINEIVIGYTAIGYGSNTVTLGNDNITNTYLKGNIIASGSVKITGSVTTAPTTIGAAMIVNVYGSSAATILGDPIKWLSIQVDGATYKLPLYS